MHLVHAISAHCCSYESEPHVWLMRGMQHQHHSTEHRVATTVMRKQSLEVEVSLGQITSGCFRLGYL